jgi:PAS domain S-box-containing protein
MIWLRNHKTIKVGMSPVIPPLKFSENGVIKGIEPDYLNLLSEYTGIQFEYVICDFSLMDAKVKSGEIDMFLSFIIPERLSYMTFTEPFMEFKQVLVARSDAPFMSGIGALKGKKMATVKGIKLYDKLLSPYPEIEVVPVNTMEEMFKAVSESKADALITKTYLAGYVMQNYPNLKIAGVADLPPEPYFYAVRKDYPELVSILNKAIASIPKDRIDSAFQKWFSIRLEYRPNLSEMLKWALVIGGVFVLILGLSLLWNRRLAKEIDIRKKVEETLRESEERYRSLFENMLDGFAYCRMLFDDQDRPVDLVYLDVNTAFEQLTGLKDVVGKKITELIPEIKESTPELFEIYGRVALTGKPERFEIDVKPLARWLYISVYSMTKGSFVAVFDDITERKRADAERIRLEHQLQQARKAESLGRMAGAIADHFNNKLMIVSGNLELALYGVGPNEKLATLLLHAQTATSQAAEVSGLMLAYLGQTLPKAETFDLAKVCHEVVETQRSSIPQRVTMMIDIPPHGPTIKANPAQVRQVLSNLIVNAWEAIGEGDGEIRASLRIVDATETSSPHIFPADWKPEEDTYACLEVSDSGCGIDPEQLDLIFDPFFSTRFTGRGLGLAVALGTVRSSGGVIAVASEPGRGSAFRVFWPVAEEEAQPVQKAEVEVSRPIEGSGLVLFVDDEAQLRNMAEMMLERLGFKVLKACHGLEALEIFRMRKDEIRLVILDLTMPGMNGWETLEALRALRPDIPVVLASGYDEAMAMEGKHAELPQAFLHKPYSMAELKAALGAAVVESHSQPVSAS